MMYQSWLILSCCYFCWIKRDANSIVHELSKYVLYSNISYFCKCVSLPLAVMETWESNVDIPSFCSFTEIFTFIHTKKKKTWFTAPNNAWRQERDQLRQWGKRPSITSPSCQWIFFFLVTLENSKTEIPISTWLNILTATQHSKRKTN